MANDELRDKVLNLADTMKAEFLERDRVIEGLILALLSRQHILLLGPPGTSKSLLATSICHAIGGAEYFEWLMNRFTVPEDLFGPIAMSKLKNDEYQRNTKRKMPQAHVMFMDETFKGNSAIQNACLKAVNERKFDNGGDAPIDIPLETVIGASNEMPEGGPRGELGAWYDRFLLRYWVEDIKSDTNFCTLVADEDVDGNDAEPDPKVPHDMITMGELHLAQAQVRQVRMTYAAAERLAELRRELGTKGVAASSRRWKTTVKALKANAWLSGDTEVTEDHFSVLADCLWEEPEQRREVAVVVQSFCGQGVGEALRVHDALIDLITNLPTDSQERMNQLTKVTREGKRADEELTKLIADATSTSNANAIEKLQAQVTAALVPLRKEARAALGI